MQQPLFRFILSILCIHVQYHLGNRMDGTGSLFLTGHEGSSGGERFPGSLEANRPGLAYNGGETVRVPTGN